MPFSDLSYARVDTHRELRQGASEAILGQGKTPEQVRAEVFKAATQLCVVETYGASFPIDEMRACVDATVRATLAQSADPKVKLAANH